MIIICTNLDRTYYVKSALPTFTKILHKLDNKIALEGNKFNCQQQKLLTTLSKDLSARAWYAS